MPGPEGFVPDLEEKLDFSKIPVSPEVDAESGEERIESLASETDNEAPLEEKHWAHILEDMDKEAQIALAEVQEELIQMAGSRDKLTGLQSLQSDFVINGEMRHRINQSLRAGDQPTFLYIDLDGFKAVNDTISHDAGDIVLYEFGQAMSDVFRGEDMKLREGGDEFGALLFNADAENRRDAVAITRKLSDRFNERLRAMPEKATTPGGKEVDFPGNEIANMVAFSAATVTVETEDIRDAKSKADKLLQEAKRSIPKEEPTGFAGLKYKLMQAYRNFRNLPPDVEEGKNYLVVDGKPDTRYQIEDNPDLKLHSR